MMAETKEAQTSQNSKIAVQNGQRVRPPSQIKNRQKVVHHTAEAQFNGLNRNQILQQQIPGVGIVAQMLKPRKLESSKGDEYISLELFEKIKENSLLCQICTGIYFEPKSAGSCLHKFCKSCIDMYIKRIKKNCPMCRQFIMSHRNLRDDHKTKKIVEIMISNTQKYNENLQNLRQVEIEQVHNFAKFRQQMESRYQRQIQSTIEQELELKAQQQIKQLKATEDRLITVDGAATVEENARKPRPVDKSAARPDAPVHTNRRGRPPKVPNSTSPHMGQSQSMSMSVVVKEEQSSPEQSEPMIDQNGQMRKQSSKKREKIIVPIQPRNANGTFAPCSSNMIEEEQAMVAPTVLPKPPVEKRMAKDRQRQDRDVIRINSHQSLKGSLPLQGPGSVEAKEIFKVGKKHLSPDEQQHPSQQTQHQPQQSNSQQPQQNNQNRPMVKLQRMHHQVPPQKQTVKISSGSNSQQPQHSGQQMQSSKPVNSAKAHVITLGAGAGKQMGMKQQQNPSIQPQTTAKPTATRPMSSPNPQSQQHSKPNTHTQPVQRPHEGRGNAMSSSTTTVQYRTMGVQQHQQHKQPGGVSIPVGTTGKPRPPGTAASSAHQGPATANKVAQQHHHSTITRQIVSNTATTVLGGGQNSSVRKPVSHSGPQQQHQVPTTSQTNQKQHAASLTSAGKVLGHGQPQRPQSSALQGSTANSHPQGKHQFQSSSQHVVARKTSYPATSGLEKSNKYIKLVAKLQTTENGITKRKVGDVHTYNTVKNAQFFKTKEGATTTAATVTKTHMQVTTAASAASRNGGTQQRPPPAMEHSQATTPSVKQAEHVQNAQQAARQTPQPPQEVSLQSEGGRIGKPHQVDLTQVDGKAIIGVQQEKGSATASLQHQYQHQQQHLRQHQHQQQSYYANGITATTHREQQQKSAVEKRYAQNEDINAAGDDTVMQDQGERQQPVLDKSQKPFQEADDGRTESEDIMMQQEEDQENELEQEEANREELLIPGNLQALQALNKLNQKRRQEEVADQAENQSILRQKEATVRQHHELLQQNRATAIINNEVVQNVPIAEAQENGEGYVDQAAKQKKLHSSMAAQQSKEDLCISESQLAELAPPKITTANPARGPAAGGADILPPLHPPFNFNAGQQEASALQPQSESSQQHVMTQGQQKPPSQANQSQGDQRQQQLQQQQQQVQQQLQQQQQQVQQLVQQQQQVEQQNIVSQQQQQQSQHQQQVMETQQQVTEVAVQQTHHFVQQQQQEQQYQQYQAVASFQQQQQQPEQLVPMFQLNHHQTQLTAAGQQILAAQQPQPALSSMQPKSYLEDIQSKQIQFQQQIIYQLYQAYIQTRFYHEQVQQQLQLQQMAAAAQQQQNLAQAQQQQQQNLGIKSQQQGHSPLLNGLQAAQWGPSANNFPAASAATGMPFFQPPNFATPTIMAPQQMFPMTSATGPTGASLIQSTSAANPFGFPQFTASSAAGQGLPAGMVQTTQQQQQMQQVMQQQSQQNVAVTQEMLNGAQGTQQQQMQMIQAAAQQTDFQQHQIVVDVNCTSSANQQQQQMIQYTQNTMQVSPQPGQVLSNQQYQAVLTSAQVGDSTPDGTVSPLVNQQQAASMLHNQQAQLQQNREVNPNELVADGNNNQANVAAADQISQMLQQPGGEGAAGPVTESPNEVPAIAPPQQQPDADVAEIDKRNDVIGVEQELAPQFQVKHQMLDYIEPPMGLLQQQSLQQTAVMAAVPGQMNSAVAQQQQYLQGPVTSLPDTQQQVGPADAILIDSNGMVIQSNAGGQPGTDPPQKTPIVGQDVAGSSFSNALQPQKLPLLGEAIISYNTMPASQQDMAEGVQNQALQHAQPQQISDSMAATFQVQPGTPFAYQNPSGTEGEQPRDSVQLFNGQGTVQLDDVLKGVFPLKNIEEQNPLPPISTSLHGKDVFFDMQVDTQFPNIFREKNIKQPFTMFHIKTNIEAKASQLINTLLEKLNAVGRRETEIQTLGITQRNISLYFHCDKGNRWWFENTQRVADIIDSGYWKPESILKNDRNISANNGNTKSLKCIYFVIYKRC